MKNICVYCGSSAGRLPVYASVARELGAQLVARGLGLVYGGSGIGLMKVVADAVLERGGHVTGVIPEALVKKDIAHRGLSEQRITSSMHERKMVMAELSDGFVALPGGAGTLEEIFESWTWGQLGLHGKPCGLLNVAGYYDGLVAFLDYAVAEQFVKETTRAMLLVSDDPGDLLDRFESYQVPTGKTWLREGETER